MKQHLYLGIVLTAAAVYLLQCAPMPPATPQAIVTRPPHKGVCIAGVSSRPKYLKDDTTFRRRAQETARRLGWDYAEIHSGVGFLRLMATLTQRHGAIGHVALFSHGDEHGVFFRDGAGLYRDHVAQRQIRGYGGAAGEAFVLDLAREIQAGRVAFRQYSRLALMSCHSAPLGLALHEATGQPVICATERIGPVNTPDDSAETGLFRTLGKFQRFEDGRATPLGRHFIPTLYFSGLTS